MEMQKKLNETTRGWKEYAKRTEIFPDRETGLLKTHTQTHTRVAPSLVFIRVFMRKIRKGVSSQTEPWGPTCLPVCVCV